MVVLKNTGGVDVCLLSLRSGALPADAPGQLHVPWHDGHPLGVDGAQVRVWGKRIHENAGIDTIFWGITNYT